MGDKIYLPCPDSGAFVIRILSGDKTVAAIDGKPQPDQKHLSQLMRVSVGFPPLAKTTVRRNFFMTTAPSDDPKAPKPKVCEICLHREVSSIEVLAPPSVEMKFELHDFDEHDGVTKSRGQIFTHTQAKLLPTEASPLLMSLLGTCEAWDEENGEVERNKPTTPAAAHAAAPVPKPEAPSAVAPVPTPVVKPATPPAPPATPVKS